MSRTRKGERRTRRPCRSHCGWCMNNRTHPRERVQAAAKQDLKQYIDYFGALRNTQCNYED